MSKADKENILFADQLNIGLLCTRVVKSLIALILAEIKAIKGLPAVLK